MKAISLLCLVCALSACSSDVDAPVAQANEGVVADAVAQSASAKAYGAELSLSDATTLTELLADRDAFVDKKIRVTGTVVGVCKKRGCWINIGAGEGEKVRFKVQDGVMVFPMSAKGSQVTAEGIWTKQVISVERLREMEAKHAKEEGEDFDPATITEPYIGYQLTGLGAVIDG